MEIITARLVAKLEERNALSSVGLGNSVLVNRGLAGGNSGTSQGTGRGGVGWD